MPNPSQEPPASSKAPNEDLKDKDLLCTFKIKILSQNVDYGCIKDQCPYLNKYEDAKPKSGTSSILQSPISGLNDMDVLCTSKIKIESQIVEHGCIKNHWPYAKHDKDAKSQSGTSSILQSKTSGLKGHVSSLQLQNQDREPKFGTWRYEVPLIIFKSW